MPFFGLFMCTKCAELGLFVYDPTIKGDMGLMVFLMKFVPSSLGYLDGYTDATAITIAFACNDNEVAQKIGAWMAGTYVVGVILCQWVVVAYLASQDSTHACLMKLIHFDAVSACISLPKSSKTTWFVINMARTVGEDIPQALLQILFLMHVKKNCFMIASVALSVLSSMKGLYDGVNRPAVAMGATLDDVQSDPTLDHVQSDPAEDEKSRAVVVSSRLLRLKGSDAGSKARQNLSYFEYRMEGWLMLGHSFGEDMMLVTPGKFVKRATGWKRIWNDERSGNPKDFDMFIPTCDDPDFIAVGVFCVFQEYYHPEPPADTPAAVVHKSVCLPTDLGPVVWSDAGTGARWDVTLNLVPRIRTMWPSIATLHHPGDAHDLNIHDNFLIPTDRGDD